jgi:hypothetical protein
MKHDKKPTIGDRIMAGFITGVLCTSLLPPWPSLVLTACAPDYPPGLLVGVIVYFFISGLIGAKIFA